MCQSVQWSIKAILPCNNDGHHMLCKIKINKVKSGSLLCNNFHDFLNHGIHAIIKLFEERFVCVYISEKIKYR